MDEMEANRPHHAGRAKVFPKLAAHRSLIRLGQRQSHERGKYRMRFGHLLIGRTAQVTWTALTVISPLVLVMRLLRLASRVLVSHICTVIPAHPRNLIVCLSTRMHVVRTAPQHRVGEQHDGG